MASGLWVLKSKMMKLMSKILQKINRNCINSKCPKPKDGAIPCCVTEKGPNVNLTLVLSSR